MAAKPPLVRTIVLHGGFVCTSSIIATQWVLSKHYSDHSSECGALLDSTICAQDIFLQILCVCHKGVCVISVIRYVGGPI